MEMNVDFFQALYDDLMSEIMDFTDRRPEAIKALEQITYAQHSIYRPVLDADYYFEEVEFAKWDENMDCQPAWTGGEEAYDEIDMAHFHAECESHAASAWTEARFNNTK